MNSEILEKVPRLGETEEVSVGDKTVHAAYIIPLRSNWTWYLTEYDPETEDAFGLVIGMEPEWGYFNIKELREVGAERLILEDFPKTFKELRDSELKKQLSEEEIHRVFFGELDDFTRDEVSQEVDPEIFFMQGEDQIDEELYEKFMNNDGISLINDYFDELIYDLDYNPVLAKEKDIEPAERSNEYSELFSKMDNFVNAYTELSNSMYDIDYDFADDYPLDKSFQDIDFISWAETSKLNISEENKEKSFEKTNAIKDKKDNIKESTIEKLNKLKDKVAKDSVDKLQGKIRDKKKDREI